MCLIFAILNVIPTKHGKSLSSVGTSSPRDSRLHKVQKLPWGVSETVGAYLSSCDSFLHFVLILLPGQEQGLENRGGGARLQRQCKPAMDVQAVPR